MPYDKDLRDLLRATKKVSRPLPETIEERARKIHNAAVPPTPEAVSQGTQGATQALAAHSASLFTGTEGHCSQSLAARR